MPTTKQYDLFKFSRSSRAVSQDFVSKLMHEYKRYGGQDYPVLVNPDMTIRDGQHRFVAAMQLGLPVTYKVMTDAELKKLNLNLRYRPWRWYNYVWAWVQWKLFKK